MKKYLSYIFSATAIFTLFSSCEENKEDELTPVIEKPAPHLHKIAESLGQPFSQDLFFSKEVICSCPKEVMQWFDIAPSGKIYYAQKNSEQIVIGRAPGANEPAWSFDHAMKFVYFGHGDTLSVEENEDGKTYIWVQSNGTQKNGKADYWGSLSVSRVEFEPGVKYENCAGKTYFYTGHLGLIIDIDFDNRRFFAGTFVAGFFVATTFDLDEVLALEEKDIAVSTVVDGKEYKRTVKGYDLADLTPLGQFKLLNGAPNKGTDILSYDHQGNAVYGDYVYLLEGNTVSVSTGSGKECIAYVTVFDLQGNIVVPRTLVKAAQETEGWIIPGYYGSIEPEGIKVRADGIYIGFVSKPTDTADPRLSYILKYQCDLCK